MTYVITSISQKDKIQWIESQKAWATVPALPTEAHFICKVCLTTAAALPTS